jgi:hypothetical protein
VQKTHHARPTVVNATECCRHQRTSTAAVPLHSHEAGCHCHKALEFCQGAFIQVHVRHVVVGVSPPHIAPPAWRIGDVTARVSVACTSGDPGAPPPGSIHLQSESM